VRHYTEDSNHIVSGCDNRTPSVGGSCALPCQTVVYFKLLTVLFLFHDVPVIPVARFLACCRFTRRCSHLRNAAARPQSCSIREQTISSANARRVLKAGDCAELFCDALKSLNMMDATGALNVQQLLRAVPHPYVGIPDDSVLEGYHDILLSSEFILGVFFSVIGVLLCGLLAVTKQVAMGERLQILWFVVSGLVHVIVEGAFVLNLDFYKNTDPNMFLLELWKEYAKADSRYATADSAVVSIEACTAFVMGPMCLLCASGLFSKASWRYAAITLVSVCQFYGTVLYFLTSALEGLPHTRSEPLYLWLYFTVMNVIWLIFPALCTWDSLSKMTSAVNAVSLTRKKLA
jgi:cholestenol Delta-isomerase